MIKLMQFVKPGFWLACLLVTTLSLAPTDQLPPTLFDWWDKAQHFIAFLFLSFLGCIAYPEKSRSIVPIGLILLGFSMEIIQHFLPWRFGDLADFVADLAGIASAVLIWEVTVTALAKKKITDYSA